MTKTRLHEIESLIKEKRYLSLQELVEKYGVSESTIRRDFEKLENKGILYRNHGGAVINSEVLFEKKNFRVPIPIFNQSEKDLIGFEAAKQVKEGEIIAIGSGTTCLEFSRFLHDKKNLTVITNNAYVAIELSFFDNIKVITTCGVVSNQNNCSNIIGTYSTNFLQNFFVDKLFCSVLGATLEMGYSDIDFDLADIWRAMLNISKQSFLLIEQHKFGMHGYVSIGKLNCIHEVITTKGIPFLYIKYYEDNGIPVHIC